MKRFIALLMCVLLIFTLACCGSSSDDELVVIFKDNSDKSAQEIADLIIQDESIPFMTATMPVEEGLLNGFGDTEIKGFTEGIMFGPMISTIPFVGYVFTLDEDTDKKAFISNLEENADLNFNICTEADEIVIDSKGDKVVVIIKPESFEDDGAESEVDAVGDEFTDDFE